MRRAHASPRSAPPWSGRWRWRTARAWTGGCCATRCRRPRRRPARASSSGARRRRVPARVRGPAPPHGGGAGATRESAGGFDVRMTAGGVYEALGEALRVAPGLATATLKEVRVGLRPASPDGLPLLGRLPGYENVLVATGHGASGLQLGPYSGALMAGPGVC